MWLKLDLDDLVFRLQIQEYRQSTRQNWDSEWCKVDFSVKAADWLNYHVDHREILLCCEVETMRDQIHSLLNNRIPEPKELSFIEPDLTFHLHPREDLRDNTNLVYIAPGHEWIDIDMEMEIHTWDSKGALTENRIVTMFVRDELEVMLCFLKLI